jgi:dipeptide transport system permease protein
MSRLLLRQLMLLLSSLFALTLFTFFLTLFFPEGSDFISHQLNSESANIIAQYLNYLQNILQGQWGVSETRETLVFNDFFTYFPATVELSLSALVFALLFGIPFGILAAENKNKWQDKLIVSTTLVGYSMPIFWWGMLLVLLFSVSLGVTPVASRLGFEYDIIPVTGFMLIDTLLSDKSYAINAFYDALRHLLLPTIVLGTVPLAIFTRVTRSAMIEVLSSDYIRTAKAKGLPIARIVWIHALRNALLPILTIVGLQISILITGTLITETIFSWPGIGKWLLEAVYRRDYATIHGGILAIASIVIATNILIEFVSHYLNPRLRSPK